VACTTQVSLLVIDSHKRRMNRKRVIVKHFSNILLWNEWVIIIQECMEKVQRKRQNAYYYVRTNVCESLPN
jgi:hypothetical protein